VVSLIGSTGGGAALDAERSGRITMANAPDLPLVERSQSGDVEAFAVLVSRYRDRVFSFVRHSVQDPDQAEDLAQDVFVKAFVGITRFNKRASFATWLFRIAHNRVVDQRRRDHRRRAIRSVSLSMDGDGGDALIDIADERSEPFRALTGDELELRVREAVERLSDKLRTVLLLYDFEGMSYQEIAGILQCPMGTVKSRLFLARTALRDALAAYLSGDDRSGVEERGGLAG